MGKRGFIIILMLSAVGFAFGQSPDYSSGKTFGNEVKFEFKDPPHFRTISKDSVNGKPAFDYFLLIKAKLNGVYDIKGGLQAEETFNVGKIDVWGSDDTKRYWMDMHQSQVRIRGQSETSKGTFIGYLEGDFWAGNKRFRLRHLWVDFKFIHFGQDWSFFGDKEIWPNVFEWDGPPSGVWRREPELKLYFESQNSWRFEFGVAQPGAEILFNTDVDATITEAQQSVPDFIGAVNKETDFGHIRATGILRNLKYKTADSEESVPGFGGTISGYVRTSKKTENPIQFQFVGGQGIATYQVSFSGLNYDAAPDGSGNIKAIPTFGGWASYEHWFTRQWHGNLVMGFSNFSSHEISAYEIPGPGFQAENSQIDLKHQYLLLNLMYDPVPNLILGLEWNIGRKETIHEGSITTDEETVSRVEKSRVAHRISFGLFFNF